MEYLLYRGASVNAKTNLSATPLHLAAQSGHLKIVMVLVQHGADVNAETSENWTPLHLASAHGRNEVCKFLIRHNAKINTKQLLYTAAFVHCGSDGESELLDSPIARRTALNKTI